MPIAPAGARVGKEHTMSDRFVRDVMTREVVTATPSTPFKAIAEMLASHRIGAVPVVDDARRPVGIVSEADLLLKQELAGASRRPPMVPALDSWLHRRARHKASGLRAADVMTTPVVTVEPGRTLADTARVLHARRLRHAPVVDGAGRLIGIVARSDLLRPFAMDDDALRLTILSEILDARLGLRWDTVRVEVAGGVVTLRGRLERRVEAVAVRQAVEAQPGVVAVVDLLTYAKEDGLDDLLPPGGEVDAGRKTRW
jgi:CBS-domain-containing membrane protein